ncbi:MAG: hypothetical protein D6737_03990 [Chloroflexi bacterium]|nr:MAG: hypothetical protein D6737_03990 [Chloroflexota bacterium]
MIYEIHLYVPKTGRLTPLMMEWLFEYGLSDAPEMYWPVRRVKPKSLARLLLAFDNALVPQPGPGGDVELHHPDENLDLLLYIHDRGVIIFFPYMAYSVLSQIVVRIAYTYIRFLYDNGGFWSFDPQLNVISYADDFQSIDDTIALMDAIMPRLLTD